MGGFAYGAWLAGMKFENHYCSDIEPYCQKLYKLRFPDSIQLGDITKIDILGNDYGKDEYCIRSETGEYIEKESNWIITGGFPCQDISIAGKGAGIEGKRSGLWFEYWRIIRDLQPKFAIMENVGAITFRGLKEVIGSLAEIGYNAEWQDIRASDLGAPHRRERIWIVAYSFSKHADNTGYGASEICWKRSKKTKIQKLSNWNVEPSMDRLANGISGRVDQLKGLGNSIVPQIAELLFRRIKELL